MTWFGKAVVMSLFSQSDSGIVWSFPVSAGRLFDYVALLKPRVVACCVYRLHRTGDCAVPCRFLDWFCFAVFDSAEFVVYVSPERGW